MHNTTHLQKMILLIIALSLFGCDYTIRNVRIVPTYVCIGDNILPYATWEYSGPKGKIKLTTANDTLLCEAGARTGYCPFNRSLTDSDLPLKAKIYKKNEKKGEIIADYLILSGQTPTEFFPGSYEFGDPYEKCIEHKVIKTDNTVEVRRECFEFIATNKVTWPISADWFSPRVETWSVLYKRGNQSIKLSGPGINSPTQLNVGQMKAGNHAHPGGLWVGEFTPALERQVTDSDYQPDFTLILNIACQ